MVRRSRNAAGGFLRDFREFALKGNVVDLAVAVIIGGAFGQIINSFVEDLVMPGIINPLLAQTGADWRELSIGPGIKIGSFFGSVVDFVIIALVLFLLIRSLERLKRREAAQAEAEPPAPDPAIAVQERLADTLDRLTSVLDSQQ
ncbi:large conductance mechanosensitive channel protein MscL [Trichothermofontia sp.]